MPVSTKRTVATILVVDNQEPVLHKVVTLLKDAGFRVLSASSGGDAIKLAGETDGKIHLLLSAVDLPTISGPALGAELKTKRPDLLVMLMSGQENGNLLVLNYGWAYISEHRLSEKLVAMVTSVLQSPDRSQLGDEFDSAKDLHRTA